MIKSSVNVMSLQLECTRVPHVGLLVSVLIYGRKTLGWKEKERPRIRYN